MEDEIILKTYPKLKQVNIFFVGISCFRYGYLMVQKICVMCTEAKKKKKNDTIKNKKQHKLCKKTTNCYICKAKSEY